MRPFHFSLLLLLLLPAANADAQTMSFYSCNSWSQMVVRPSDLRSIYRTVYSRAGFDSSIGPSYAAKFQTRGAGRVIQETLDFATSNTGALRWLRAKENWDAQNITAAPAANGGVGENSAMLYLCDAMCAGTRLWFRRGAMDVSVSILFQGHNYGSFGDPNQSARALGRLINSRLIKCGYPG